MKHKHTLAITVYVTVESSLESLEDLIDEFGSECSYEFPSTDNVKVIGCQWIDTELVN